MDVQVAPQEAGEPVDVGLGLLPQVFRRHDLPKDRRCLVAGRDVNVAQQPGGLFHQRLVQQYLVVDACVGAGVADGSFVNSEILQPLGETGRHQEEEQSGENRRPQRQGRRSPQERNHASVIKLQTRTGSQQSNWLRFPYLHHLSRYLTGSPRGP